MGRWSQRRQRGGGGGVTTAPVSITSVVDIGDNSVAVTFSAPVTIVPSFVANGAFQCGSDEALGGDQGAANVINLDMGASETGQDWHLVAQPSWLLEPASFPSSGSVG